MAHIFKSTPSASCSPQDEAFTAMLRAVSHQDRAQVTHLLGETLLDCGCWIQHRAGSASGLILAFEAPLRGMSELYPGLLECGLDFDRRGRCELEMLCTLGRYALEREGLSRLINLRLDLTFADELSPGLRSTLAMHA